MEFDDSTQLLLPVETLDIVQALGASPHRLRLRMAERVLRLWSASSRRRVHLSLAFA